MGVSNTSATSAVLVSSIKIVVEQPVKNKPAIVAGSGPSLNEYKKEISEHPHLVKFFVNEWYDFFNERPDYWIVSNGEFTIDASINGSHIWTQREYPQDVFNKYGIPLFYNAAADLTNEEVIEQHLKCDYLSYDTRHFCGDTCIEIFKNFKNLFLNYSIPKLF